MYCSTTLGPQEPAYPTVCCEEFRPGQVCDGTIGNILEALVDVPDISSCQGLCQVRVKDGNGARYMEGAVPECQG